MFLRPDAAGAIAPRSTDLTQSIYNRYNRWSKRRTWQRIFEKMAAAADQCLKSFASIPVMSKPDRSAAGSRRGSTPEAIGRSRGGRTSKIHALADDRGRPVAFALTPGNVADITMAIPLLGAVDKPKRLLADKAYDADSLRHWLKRRKIKAVIPSTATRRRPYPLDPKIYRRRNVIERMFCKLKNWRRIATRYDRHAQNYLSALALAAIMCQWI